MDLLFVIVVLSMIPLWIFFIPLFIVTTMCVRFWSRVRFRMLCIVCDILIFMAALVVLLVQLAIVPPGDERLAMNFGNIISADEIARYQFYFAGLGDTTEYWKLKNVARGGCQEVIDAHNLRMVPNDKLSSPMSLTSAPWWWPRSMEGFAVYEADDGYGGSTELWIRKKGGVVYLFRFIE
jgi:hypothetical protein